MKKILLITAFVLACVFISNAQTQKLDSLIILPDTSVTNTYVNTGGCFITGIVFEDSVKGSDITFQDSWDGITFNEVFLASDSSNLKVLLPKVTTSSSRKIIFKPADHYPLAPFVKLRTGTLATPVEQTDTVKIWIELFSPKGD